MTAFAWSLDRFTGATGAGVRVAVVDSGIHAAHPHVDGIVDAVAIGADGQPLPLTFPDDRLSDRIGHGTAVARATATGALVVAAAPQPEAAWLPGGLPGVVSVEADWDGARDTCRGQIDGAGALRLVASAYPRPIPGVPPDLNFRGLSFAVANATGFLALAWPNIPGRGGMVCP